MNSTAPWLALVVCATASVCAEKHSDYYEHLSFAATNAIVGLTYSNRGDEGVRFLCEERCGAFSTNTWLRYWTNSNELVSYIHIDERLRLMTGMFSALRITPKDVLKEIADQKFWSVKAAREAARRDISNNTIRIYWSGGVAVSRAGIDADDESLVSDYPSADLNLGDLRMVPAHAMRYADEYNREIVRYLRAR